MIAALSKFRDSLKAPKTAEPDTSPAPVAKSRSSRKIDKFDPATTRAGIENLSEANIQFQGDPENQVIVFDLDETLLAGDKHPIDKKREAQINAMSDRHVETVPKDHPLNKRGEDIKYVLRPGAKELLEYLNSRGYKMIACTRNYTDRGESICEHDPVLSKYISGCLGRSDLESDLNKDFKKYPKHCDNIGIWKKFKGFLHTTFVYTPKYLWLKFKSLFNKSSIRFNPEVGKLGKYPLNMLELLKAKGNTKLEGLQAPRFLVDNSDKRETRDMKQSGDWAYINSNVDKNGDGKATAFYALDECPKQMLTDPDTQEQKEGYEWVKKVVTGIEQGWRAQYQEMTGKAPA